MSMHTKWTDLPPDYVKKFLTIEFVPSSLPFPSLPSSISCCLPPSDHALCCCRGLMNGWMHGLNPPFFFPFHFCISTQKTHSEPAEPE